MAEFLGADATSESGQVKLLALSDIFVGVICWRRNKPLQL